MTKKIFRSIFIVAITILLACLVLIIGVLYDYFRAVQKNQLKTELYLASEAVENSGLDYLTGLDDDSCRLTWVSVDGSVLYDSENSAELMENHADREEIKEAFQSGFGESSRYSSTLTQQTLYCAKLLSDGSVLRVSVSHATIPILLFGMLQPLVVIFVLALILSAVLAHRLSEKIVEPLNSIDLEKPLENNTYDELSPVLTHIERQHRQIAKQMHELDRSRCEFEAVTQNMNEGLVLLSSKSEILSINPSAASFFLNVNPSSAEFFEKEQGCIGKDFLSIDRSREINKALDVALEKGRSEIRISRSGREYQLNASRIDASGNNGTAGSSAAGIVLLIFDVTDKVFAERNRKEFTANVSHELKTPLQAIMGSAELIENGLVKKEDMPRFIGHIRSEAQRLVALIDDIIRLSQLDENVELQKENVNIYELSSSIIDSMKNVSESKNVSISLEGTDVIIPGVRQLFYEIIYNLCDNAIKYNVDGGKVAVKIESNDSMASITVEDTGIGIPPEHQPRIFERFYRVDKSHSKETGGTGLGLSIVKHSVSYLGGRIELHSEVGVGTKITVYFPKQ